MDQPSDFQSAPYYTTAAPPCPALDGFILQAVSPAVGDYNVPYLYFMAFISYLSAPDLYLIKLFSIIFDVILA